MSSLARAERLPVKTYTTVDGLAHNNINKIVRDSRGFLWFCTGDGLSRFDGYTFTNYGTDQGLPLNTVNDLLEPYPDDPMEAYPVSTKVNSPKNQGEELVQKFVKQKEGLFD